MAKSNKFGTFGGVFAPSILTIMGVIMYLRLPAIIGEAGLWATIGIIVIAHIISMTTGLSVSSIATDKKVKAGGTYYMISRSLGLPIGGTLGLALFVGLSFSVSLYLIGFSESFLNYWGFDAGINNIRIAGTIVLISVTTVTFISTSLALKTQYFIMAAIVLSLISIFAGTHDFKPAAPLFTNSSSTVPLMVLFGIFFPAVTGFEAGVSMSGDLKDSKKSIPRGSIAAILVGFVAYIGLAFYFSYTVDGAALAGDSQILLKIARFPELVVAGIWGATLSSALGSILGAPRILQATAIDKITGKFFAKGHGASNEPRNALLLTFLIAEAGILIGELDVIARVVSIFFITTYGFLNLSCAFETWTSADFRPQFKVSGWISLIGAIACFIVMIELDFVATIAASLLLGLLFFYLKRKELTLDSGDAWASIWATLVKKGLQRLTKDKLTGRNWRPNVLLFTGDEAQRPELLEAGKLITGNMGILSAFELIESNQEILPKPKIVFDEKDKDVGYFKHQHVCHDVFQGMEEISRIYGFSGVQPNTVLMGWSRDINHRDDFLKTISGFEKQDYNTMFLSYDKSRAFGDNKTIDIWWHGSGRNLAFALYLTRHLTASLIWKPAKIRICYINEVNSERDQLIQSFQNVLSNYRIQSEIEIINNELDQHNPSEIITAKSSETDLVIIGLPDVQQKTRYQQMDAMLGKLGSTLVVKASGQFEEISIQAGNKQLSEMEADEADMTLLPDLMTTDFPVLSADMQKVDERGMKLVELLHQKLFVPVLAENALATGRLIDLVKGLERNLESARAFPEAYRQKRQFIKAKNEFLFGVRRYLRLLNEDFTENKQEAITEAVGWYSERLLQDTLLFPNQLSLTLDYKHIAPKVDDSAVVKGIKFRKRVQTRYKNPRLKLSYRKLATRYMYSERQVALKSFLESLLKEEEQFLLRIKDEINRAYNLWEHLDLKSEEAIKPFEEITSTLSAELVHQKELAQRYANRLRLDLRKQVQRMGRELSQLDTGAQLKKAKRYTKQRTPLVSENLDFGPLAKEHLTNLISKIYADISIIGLQSRVQEKIDDFKFEMVNSVQKNLDKVLTRYQEAVVKDQVKNFAEPDLEVQSNLTLLFEKHHKAFDKLINDLPETLELALHNEDQEEEVNEVPIRKIADYYIKSSLISPTEESLALLQEQLKKAFVSCREMLSLARFNLNNLDNPEIEDGLKKEKLLTDCKGGITTEKQLVDTAIKDFLEQLDENVQAAFEPISATKLLSTSANFSRSLLDHQSQQVKSGVLHLSKRIRQFSTNQLSRLLYSRSRGLIFAKKLTQEPRESITSRLLDYKEQVTPSAEVLKALPSYYISLFSGRSSIDKEFWIKRPAEEALFKKAIQRYKEGFHGGVLVTGERNTGKTTFSRIQASKYYKANRSFQLFPKLEGSVALDDFAAALNEATGIHGTLEEIMNTVPQGSVIIIHDLELWWQRSEDGLTIVKKLCELIDEYGKKCLFVVNLNPYTLRLINKLIAFNDYFIEVINCRAFESQELKNLIMTRHQSTGLVLSMNGKNNHISELGIAKLFDGYFNMSKGNPGVALNAWLTNIVRVNDSELVIRQAHTTGISALKDMNADWQLVLLQLLLHKRLSFDRLQEVMLLDEPELETILLAMSRAALLTEKKHRVYIMEPHMEPLILQALKDKELL